jgi:hypothetical protein
MWEFARPAFPTGMTPWTPRNGSSYPFKSRGTGGSINRRTAGSPQPSGRRQGSLRAKMKREILINAGPRETRVAILEDERLVELLVDRPDNRRMVGDIYLGRVEAVLPGIQAAFVDIGTEKSAFLHASDLVRESADEAAEEEDEEEEEEKEQPASGRRNGGQNGGNGGDSNGGGRRSRKAPPIQDAL